MLAIASVRHATLSVIKSIPRPTSRDRESKQKRASGNTARSSWLQTRYTRFISVSWLRNSLRETSEKAVFPLQTFSLRNSLNEAVRKSPSPPILRNPRFISVCSRACHWFPVHSEATPAHNAGRTSVKSILELSFLYELAEYYIWSMVLYGSENWALTNLIINSLKVFKCGAEGYRTSFEPFVW